MSFIVCTEIISVVPADLISVSRQEKLTTGEQRHTWLSDPAGESLRHIVPSQILGVFTELRLRPAPREPWRGPASPPTWQV